MTEKQNKIDKIYLILLIIVIVITSIIGFVFLYGTNIRGLTNDLERIERINNLNIYINSYYYTSSKTGHETDKKLPEKLSDLEKGYSYAIENTYDPKDKSNNKQFEYKKTGEKKYQICADFEAGTEEISKYKAYLKSSNGGDYYYIDSLETSFRKNQVDKKFEFKAGYQCIDFKVIEY